MADNTYFKNAQAITNTVLDYLEKNNEFNEDDYYQIDILDLMKEVLVFWFKQMFSLRIISTSPKMTVFGLFRHSTTKTDKAGSFGSHFLMDQMCIKAGHDDKVQYRFRRWR